MRFNKTTRIAAAVAVIGALAAGGAAFTDTTNQPATQALGYGATSISGGNITGISYQLSANTAAPNGPSITTVTLTSSDDLTTDNNGGPASVYLSFNNDDFSTTAGAGDADCAAATYNSGTSQSTVVCTVNGTWLVNAVTSVDIAVTNGLPNGDTIG
jgi:hypothetical protein